MIWLFVYACIRLFGKCPRTARPQYEADRPARRAFLGGTSDPLIPLTPNACETINPSAHTQLKQAQVGEVAESKIRSSAYRAPQSLFKKQRAFRGQRFLVTFCQDKK